MSTCAGCGGVLGRDCFNEADCVWITQDMQMRAAQDAEFDRQAEHEHYAAMEAEHHRVQAEDFDADRLEAVGLGLA